MTTTDAIDPERWVKEHGDPPPPKLRLPDNARERIVRSLEKEG